MIPLSVMASLVFDSGPQTGERITLQKDKVTFGRSKLCDCVLAHPTVSREHFYVERNNGKLFLVDQGGENGTFVNGERISWVELEEGDKIKAGPFTMIFESDDERTELAPPAVSESQSYSREPAFDSTLIEAYPREYLQGIEDFNAGRYFDAHEVWEEIWLRSSGERKLFYQMLIQTAVGLHHYERGNARGARGMYANVTEKLGRLPSSFMSLDLAGFSRQFKAALSELIDNNNEDAPADDKHRPRIELLSDSADQEF
jgi:predicted metal-dependent hydrolase